MNYALHMIAVIQARGIGPGRAYLDKQTGPGKDRVAALRLLRRRLSDVVFANLRTDNTQTRKSPDTPVRFSGSGLSTVEATHGSLGVGWGASCDDCKSQSQDEDLAGSSSPMRRSQSRAATMLAVRC